MIKSFTAKFCDEAPHFTRFYLVDDSVEAKSILPGWEDDMEGLCDYSHNQKNSRKCRIVLLKSKLTVGLLVHECTHATAEWVHAVSMPAAMKELPESEHEGYYSEALARVNENLVNGFFVHYPLSAEADLYRELSKRLKAIKTYAQLNLSSEHRTALEDMCFGWMPNTKRTVGIKVA